MAIGQGEDHHHEGHRKGDDPGEVLHGFSAVARRSIVGIAIEIVIIVIDAFPGAAVQPLAQLLAGLEEGYHLAIDLDRFAGARIARSEEHTSELQSLMRTSYAGFCLKK